MFCFCFPFIPDSVFAKVTLASVEEVGIASKAFCLSFDDEVRSFEGSTELILTQTLLIASHRNRSNRHSDRKMGYYFNNSS